MEGALELREKGSLREENSYNYCTFERNNQREKVSMESTRQKKVARLIQRELGDFFQQKGQSFTMGNLITVTVVRITPDLSQAKIFLSIFPSKNNQEVMNIISENVKMIRHELGKRVRHQLRVIPEIFFYIDDTLDYVENIENLLKS
jgi:ribosome-binding factor A